MPGFRHVISACPTARFVCACLAVATVSTACTYKENAVLDPVEAASLGRDTEVDLLVLSDSSRVEFAEPGGRVVRDSVFGPVVDPSGVERTARVPLADVLEVHTSTEKAGTGGTITAGLAIAVVAGIVLMGYALSQMFSN